MCDLYLKWFQLRLAHVGSVRINPKLAIVTFLNFTKLQMEISNFFEIPAASRAVFWNKKVNCLYILICSYQTSVDFPPPQVFV